MTTRVVVTGAGVVSSIGAGLADFERTLYAGTSGIAPSVLFGGSVVTAEIAEFAPQQWLGEKGMRVLDRAARLVSVATHMAILDSGLAGSAVLEAGTDVGMACGTMFGALHSIANFDWSGLVDGPSYVNPGEFPNTVINSPAGQAAIKFKLRGVNSTVSAGLASGLYAVHYGAESLRFGRAKVVLAGGVEELCEESILGFRKAGATALSGLVRPFHRDGDGTVLGEGAVLLTLETAGDATARGATPWAEICGFGCAHDATSVTAHRPRAEGATWAIEDALTAAGIAAGDVGCIIASANGGRIGDSMEARALSNIFGDRLARIPASAPKAAFGEAMGASGALLALTGAIAARSGIAPPTSGCSDTAGVSLSGQPRAFDGEHVLVNAFNCDGNNTSMVIKRWTT